MPSFKFTKRQWATLAVIGLADFCNAICVSLQAPFFPNEAEKKGCSATEYGLVFGVFELVVFLISPIYGQFLNRIGPKVLFNGGILTTSCSAILFGLLDRVEAHKLFISLAFIIRIVEALGNAAFLTASFAIIAKEFPNNIGTTFASLETFFGLGLIVGPVVGGALYTVGGYFLPFVVLGSALLLTALITFCVLPKHPCEADSRDTGPSMKNVLSIPGVLVCSLGICATSASIGFLGATLEPHLRQFGLSPVLLGILFVINGGVYALTAPIWGWLVDRFVNPKMSSFAGCLLVASGFCLIGPASFVPSETTISNVILGLVLHGFGIAALLVSSFTDALRSSIKKGLPNNIETYGLISGLWTSTFALGAFIGPSAAGALYDSIGFRGAVIFIIVLHGIVGLILALFMCCEKRPSQYKELKPDEPLLKNGKINVTNGEVPYKKLHTGSISGSAVVVCDQSQTRPCGMHNLIMCNSYTNRAIPSNHNSQWSIRETSNTSGLIAIGPYYGSIDRNAAAFCQETMA